MNNRSPVPFTFLFLSFLGLYFSQMSPVFVANEVITRFIRDGIMVLALILPIAAGMGINFAVTVGAISAQIGLLTVIILRVQGFLGLAIALMIGIVSSMFLGWLIGALLNRVKGREMITTIIIGSLANGIYQFVFMVVYGKWIRPINTEILLSRGFGVRNMVDLAPYRNIMDQLWVIEAGGMKTPLFMIVLVLTFCAVLAYLLNTRWGQSVKAVGIDSNRAALLGIDVNRTRIQAMVLSTVIACIGQMIFLQNIGMLNVYTAHMNTDVFSAAALLAGGATIRKARVRNMLLGVFLFHALFIVSPQAGQNLFGNAALGEYFRSFVAYGTIAFALVMNIRQQNNT